MVHQLDEDNPGLAMLAAVIAVLHAGAAMLALQQASRYHLLRGDPAILGDQGSLT
jgi:hypothetical protein